MNNSRYTKQSIEAMKKNRVVNSVKGRALVKKSKNSSITIIDG